MSSQNGNFFMPALAGGGGGSSADSNLFWKIAGNATIAEASNFLGTLIDAGVLFRTNNVYRGRISKEGNFLWNTAANGGALIRAVGDFTNERFIILNLNGSFAGETSNPKNPSGVGGQIALYIDPLVNHASGKSWGVLVEPNLTSGDFQAFENTKGTNRFGSEGGKTIIGPSGAPNAYELQVYGRSYFKIGANFLSIESLFNDSTDLNANFFRISIQKASDFGMEVGNYASVTTNVNEQYTVQQNTIVNTVVNGGETSLHTLKYGKLYNGAGNGVINNLLIAPFYKQNGSQDPTSQYNAIRIEEGDLFLNSGVYDVDSRGVYKWRPVNIVLSTFTGTKIATTVNQKMAFWGSTPVVQQAVTGTVGDGAALTSLLTKLALIGLIDNQTTGGSTANQVHTSGAVVTMAGPWLVVDPSATLAALAITLPAAPADKQQAEISAGGTLATGTVVTTLSIAPNTGQAILQATTPTTIQAGETIIYRYRSANQKWYRIS